MKTAIPELFRKPNKETQRELTLADIGYQYDDVPTIAAFSEAHGKVIRGIMGCFGSGKSAGCTIELLKMAGRQKLSETENGPKRLSRFAVIRNTYVELQDTTIKTFMQWVPDGVFGTYKVSTHTFTIDKLGDLHIEVIFRALDRPEHIKNLLSLELTGAWVNEAREIPWQIIEALTGRIGRYPSMMQGGCVEPGIIMDTNPPDTESWWYHMSETKTPKNAVFFRQPSGRSRYAENTKNLPPNYYQNMVEIMDPERVKIYVDGEYGFIREGRAVWPDYTDSLHCHEFTVAESHGGSAQLLRTWDFGLTPACALSEYVGGQWRVFDELVADSLDFHSFADAVLARCSSTWGHLRGWVDVGDPSGANQSPVAQAKDPNSCFEIARAKNIRMLPGDQALTIRLGSVAYALRQHVNGKPMFVVHPRCGVLRKALQGRYCYRKMKISGIEERYHDEPDKNQWSHIADALQYAGGRLFGGIVRGREDRIKRRKAKIAYPNSGVL